MSLDVWTALLWLSTCVVIFGVVLEEYDFIVLVLEYRAKHGWKGVLDKARERGWRGCLTKLGFAVLVVGLTAELVLQAKVELDSADQLGAATTNAANAMAAAGALGVDVTNFKKYVTERQLDVANGLDALKLAEKALVGATQRANSAADLANQHFASRHLTQTQRDSIAKSLTLAPKGDVVIVCDLVDSDSNAYKKEISDFLKSIGYNPITTKQGSNILLMGAFGLEIMVRDLHNPVAIAIQKAFMAAGIGMPGGTKPDLDPPDVVWIQIGKRI